jgi:hypothetical protein
MMLRRGRLPHLTFVVHVCLVNLTSIEIGFSANHQWDKSPVFGDMRTKEVVKFNRCLISLLTLFQKGKLFGGFSLQNYGPPTSSGL